MWEEKTNILQDMAKGDGIILLFFPANFLEGEWRVYNNNHSLRTYFHIPAGFSYKGGTFYYNFAYKYVYKSIKVFHKGVHKTEPFWHLEPSSPVACELKTDKGTKLPYLDLPSLGKQLFIPTKCYFIPVSEQA